MKFTFLFVLLLFFAGCNNKSNTAQQTSETLADTTILSQSLVLPSFEVILLPEAREITDNWLAYITAQTEIENFGNYTVTEITSNATTIVEIMQTLKETVPAEFQTNAVQTRLSVLYTKARVLEHLAIKRNSDPREIKTTAEELPLEFNNFKIQLNELFLKSLEDLEKELDAFDVEDTLTVQPERRARLLPIEN